MPAEHSKTYTTRWLRKYYAIRAAFSIIWVTVAFLVGKSPSTVAVALLVVYPAWDAAANWRDASQNGGFKANPTQAFNALVSAVVTIAVIVTSSYDRHSVLYVFGAWASVSGLLQLSTGIRRWRRVSAQWPMILSGAQSTVAGGLFLEKAATLSTVVSGVDIAPYAAFGAIYFAISAFTLAVSLARQSRRCVTA